MLLVFLDFFFPARISQDSPGNQPGNFPFLGTFFPANQDYTQMLAEQANLYASLQEWSLRKSQAKKVKSQKFGIRSPSRLRNVGWLICMHSLIYIIVQTFCEGFISVGQFCKTIELQLECFIRFFCNPRFSPKLSCSLQIALISGWLKNCKLKPTASRECREWYILSRSSPTNSEKKHNILSCFLFFFCEVH